MKMFMGLMFLIGLVLTVYAFKIAPTVKNCDSNVQNSARGILVMGVIMMSVSAAIMVCGCGIEVQHSTLGMLFPILMLAVSIITMSLTSIIHSSCIEARTQTPVLITISVLTTLLSVGYLGYKGYNKISGAQKMKSSF